MEFKVVLTSQAQLDFRNITYYLLYELKSEQATISVTNEMELYYHIHLILQNHIQETDGIIYFLNL